MAEFLDKLKGKIDKGLSTVNVKSKELIERQKIRLHMSELEAERKLVFQELGKLTYALYQVSGEAGLDLAAPQPEAPEPEALDKWDESVLTVLGRISEGELGNILFEDTDRQFKITAKTLYEEVEKLIPASEKKGQNLQWLGRVLGKFGLTTKKVSKRINGERETVYVFDKKKSRAILESARESGKRPGRVRKGGKTTPPTADTKTLLARCKKLDELDSKISKLEKQLQKTGEKVR